MLRNDFPLTHIFLKPLTRNYCYALITVSSHSKLLVFLQTAHITPWNLIIGPYYVFSAFSVNTRNLWHAPLHLSAATDGFHPIVVAEAAWTFFWP